MKAAKADAKEAAETLSTWRSSTNALKTRTLSVSLTKKKGKVYELRAQAKQKMYGYGTVQGSCSDGTYGYYILYNRKVERCKVMKVRLSDMKRVKVSKSLAVAHGNDISYDSGAKRLVVCNYTNHGMRLTLVNRKTLKTIKNVTVKIPDTLPGASSANISKIKGLSAIAYSKKRKCFVARIKGTNNLLVLNKKLKATAYLKASAGVTGTGQGMECVGDYILISASPGSGQSRNVVGIYDWEGTLLAKFKLKNSYELESVYRVGSTFYISSYRSYTKTTYKKKKYKAVVKKDGKEKKVVKTRKVRMRVFQRDNYIYKVKGL